MPDTPDPIYVLITVEFEDKLLDSFRQVSDRIDLLYFPTDDAKDVPEDVWAKAEVLYTTTAVPEVALAPRLRWIHVHYAGVDHLLDQPIIQDEGVLLTTASGIHATNIAEYVFAMLLMFGHRVPQMLRAQANADWPSKPEAYHDLVPLELRGSTLGIVGYGSIGREIARLAQAFGMEVLAVKRDVRQPADPDGYVLPGTGDPEGEYFHRLYPPEALISMVRECDFVVVTTPLTESTRLMCGDDMFKAMKESAYLINVGRGGVVDEEALLQALQDGKFAGAAMDVFEAEPLPADNPLWKQPNLIISPHVSGSTDDYSQKAAKLFVENLRRYVAREDLLNLVDLSRGY
jgi:phosphoglycerate dehydrogenase-like enzyme